MSDRIAVMGRGRVLQVSSPSELYRIPACREVAEFVGAINLLEGRVGSIDSARCVVSIAGLGDIDVCRETAAALIGELAPGSAVTVAVRPEHIGVTPPAVPSPPGAAVPGRVTHAVYLGDRSYLSVRLEGGPQILACLPGLINLTPFQPGSAVQVRVPQEVTVMKP